MLEFLRVVGPLILFGALGGYLLAAGLLSITYLLIMICVFAVISGYLSLKGENYRSPGENDASLTSLLKRYQGSLYSFLFESGRIRRLRRQSAAFAISRYARKSKSPADLSRITKFAEKQIRRRLPKWPRRYFLSPHAHEQELWPLQDLLKDAKAPDELELSREIVLATLRDGWRVPRSRAVYRIAELGGIAELPFLIGLMDNPALKISDKWPILGGLQTIGLTAGRPEVIDRVFNFMAEVKDEHQKSLVIQTLIALNAYSDPRLTPYISRGKTTPWVRFALRLKAENINGPALVERLIAAELVRSKISDATKIRMSRLLQAGIDKADLYSALLPVLGRRKGFFDFEPKYFDKGGYLAFLDALAEYSKPRVSFCDATFNGNPTPRDLPLDGAPNQESEVRCTCAGQVVVVKGLETSFLDSFPLMAAINNALEATAHAFRYYYTDSGGENVLVFLGPASGMTNLISSLDFPFALFQPNSFIVGRDPFFPN